MPPEQLKQKLSEAQTRLLFMRMQQLNVRPPTHSKSGLPRPDAQLGYAEVWQTLQALERGKPLPPLAAQVRDMLQRRNSDGQEQAPPVAPVIPISLIVATRTRSGDVDTTRLSELLAHLPELPFHRSNPENVIQNWVGETLGITATTVRHVEGKGAIGASGAPVYFIRDTNGQRIGVVKIYPEARAFASEASSLLRLHEETFVTFTSPDILTTAKVRMSDRMGGAILMSVAAGESVDDMLQRLGSSANTERHHALQVAQQAMTKVAIGLAELHTRPVGSGQEVAPRFIERHILSLNGIVSDLVANTKLKRRAGFDASLIQRRIGELSQGFRENPGHAALVHGDAHPGNFFHAEQQGLTMIDITTLHASMNEQGAPIGTPARDLTAFDERVRRFGRTYGLQRQEEALLVESFWSAYKRAGGTKMTAEAIVFFEARTALGGLHLVVQGESADATSVVSASDRTVQAQLQWVNRILKERGS